MQTCRADLGCLDRLIARTDYVRVQDNGTKWISPTVIILQTKRDDEKSQPRYGLTVTKRTSKRAVDRNRIKRRLRAAVSEALQNYTGVDIVIMGRLPALTCPYPTLVKDIKWCLKRLNTSPPPSPSV